MTELAFAKSRSVNWIWVTVAASLSLLAAVAVAAYLYLNQRQATGATSTSVTPGSSATPPTTEQIAAPVPQMIALNTNGQAMLLGLNSDADGDFAVLATPAQPAATAQQWYSQPVTIGTLTGVQFRNAKTNGLLAVNGGLGNIVVAANSMQNSTATVFNVRGAAIAPADPIYAPPQEDTQLVLAQADAGQEQAVASAIASAVSAPANKRLDSGQLALYSGQVSTGLNGQKCTLAPQNSSDARQIWTLSAL